MRRMDLVMLCLLNAQERTESEFAGLFAAAHEGFAFKGCTRAPGSRMSVVEAVWKPDAIGERDGKGVSDSHDDKKQGQSSGKVEEDGAKNEGEAYE